MTKKQINTIITELLKPIVSEIGGFASYTHGHLTGGSDGVLPWYYIKYEIGEALYSKYFSEYEKADGLENNNFYRDYRYYDVGLYSLLKPTQEDCYKPRIEIN